MFFILCTVRPSASVLAPPSRLGGLLRLRRQQLRLSTREAARRIGISPSYLVALEQGRNPSTGRAPVPSPLILAAMSQALEIETAVLLDAAGATMSPSVHLLLYQRASGFPSPLGPARRLFAGQVDAWVEIVDPRASDATESPPDDVLVRRRRERPESPARENSGLLGVLSDALADIARSSPPPRLGVIFGASSAVLRWVENPLVLLEGEATWEHDVEAELQAVLGISPAASVCVYREADIEELGGLVDPLATVLSLIQSHPHVAVHDGDEVATGPAAIETILTAARPSGVSSETWRSLARAAAAGFARKSAIAHGTRGGAES
jgi:transcriptional regulator with XRE-family HTH domain